MDARQNISEIAAEQGARPADREPLPFAPAKVELHIEELVLRGFAPKDRFHIADELERELTRLIAAGGIAGMSGEARDIERLDAGQFKVAPGMKAGGVGRQLAQTLYRGMAPARNQILPRNSTRETGKNK